MKRKGKFIVFYGVNNTGKSTQVDALVSRLKYMSMKVIQLKYPIYSSKSGQRINGILREGKEPEILADPLEFQKLYVQNRLDFEPLIKQFLRENYIVIAEDYIGTSLAWGLASGADEDQLLEINKKLLKADLEILFVGKRFIEGKEENHVHESNYDLMKRCEKTHEYFGKKLGWEFVDSDNSIKQVNRDVWKLVTKYLKKDKESIEVKKTVKILRRAGKIEIMMIAGADLKTIEKAGRTCYLSNDKITEQSAKKFVLNLMKSGHHSVIEHSLLTVCFKHISRGMTHEDVRHRLCAFSQRSTRYVDPNKSGFSFVIAPDMDEHQAITMKDGSQMTPSEMLELINNFYAGLLDAGYKKQDARQFLPIGIETEIAHSANFREWRHIFRERTAKDAHWEIREVMVMLLMELQKRVPIIFDDFILAGADESGVHYFRQIPFSEVTV